MKAFPTSPETVNRQGKLVKTPKKNLLDHYWTAETGPLCGKVLEDNLLIDFCIAREVATCPACLRKAAL